MEVLKSEKLDLVDFLFLSGQTDHLATACRVQLVAKGKMRVVPDRERLIAAARKGKGLLRLISGRRPFTSYIRKEAEESIPEGLNFYERAVYSGAGDAWFPAHRQGLVATYNRQGLMKENNVGYRGEELRRMYQDDIDALMASLRGADSAGKARLLNECGIWYFAFFALPLPLLEPKALKAFRARRNADYLDTVISDSSLVASLNDAALYAVAAAEAIAG